MADKDLEIRTNVRGVLQDLRKADKTFARETRKALRDSGQVIVEEQARILDTESPGTMTGRTYRKPATGSRGGYRRGPNVRQFGGMRLDRVEGDGGSSNRETRQTIKSGLRVRAGVGSARYGGFVRVVSTNADDVPAKAFNQKIVRHPVFGTGAWAAQKGLEWFKRGVVLGSRAARERLEKAIDDALGELRANPPVDN